MNKAIIALVFFVVLVSGCTTQPSTTTTTTSQQAIQQGTKEFNVVIGHTFYNPSTFVVNKGDIVKFLAIAASGTSSHMHGITIDEYGINQAVTNEDSQNPTVIEFLADKIGEFKIYCKTYL